MARIIVLGSHADSLLKFRREMLTSMAMHNEVIACVPNPTTAIERDLQSIGVTCCHVPLERTGLNPLADLLLIFKLYQLFKILHADVLFSYTSKPVIFGTFAARLAGIKKCYAMITGLGTYFIYTDAKSRFVRSIIIVLYKLALHFNTKVFFQNPDDRAIFTQLKVFKCPLRTVMINGSGVNLEYFKTQELPGTISFILIARLIRDKGVIEYLQAARLLQQKYPQAKCLLVGWFDAKQQALNLDLIQEYVARGAITYLGALEDVRPALAQAAVFVLPSYREGTPKGVLEAMASGRAIITTDAPGCRETVVHGENGYLVPVKNVQELYAAMERLVLNPELISSMGQRSRAMAEQKYDVLQVNKTILTAMELSYA
jgi:glycosyltransferase involved in cell wall biosynthesis